MAHSQRTAALAAIERQLDVVLEQTLHAVVGEALAQLDKGNQPGGQRQVFGDMAQRGLFVEIGLFTVGGVGQGFFAGIGGFFRDRSVEDEDEDEYVWVCMGVETHWTGSTSRSTDMVAGSQWEQQAETRSRADEEEKERRFL